MYLFIFRRKIGRLACSLPDSLFICGNCDSFDPHRRRNHETFLPDSLWPTLYIKPSNNGRVVSGVHISMHCFIPAAKSQLHCRTLSHRGSDSHYLFYYGVGALCEPTKTTSNLLPAHFVPFFFCFCLLSYECPWNYSLCIQRSQFSLRDPGTLSLGSKLLNSLFLSCKKPLIYLSLKVFD